MLLNRTFRMLRIKDNQGADMSIQSFIPPHRILMGPGPSDIYPQVLQ
ncbi:alanine--glyoxylate aminotransferase family protein, partial [Vibrio parahaemolyticus]|nr:alanine--glyoxylate aminotransferase family protein [Vibrio parahaemolyticus]